MKIISTHIVAEKRTNPTDHYVPIEVLLTSDGNYFTKDTGKFAGQLIRISKEIFRELEKNHQYLLER